MAGAGQKTGGCLLDGWAGACVLAGCVEGGLREAGGDADAGEEVDGEAAAGMEAGLEGEGGSGREDCGGPGREALREAFACRMCRLCCRLESWSCCASNFLS